MNRDRDRRTTQGTLLATSQLKESDAYGSGPVGTTFYFSLVAFATSVVVSTVLLARMLTLINRAAHGLADAAKRADTAMENFVDLRSWGILRHGEVGCLTHVAAGRGMVRALDLLIQNGANPSSVDSTGKAPLEIARESGMTEACGYLEALIASGGQRSRPCIPRISSPLVNKLRKKASRPRSARLPAEEARYDLLAGEGGGAGGSRRSSLTSGWKQIRKVAGTAVRWVGKSDKVLARRARGRVGVEPRDPCAAPPAVVAPGPAVVPSGHSPSQSVAEGAAALLQLPPALQISCGERGAVAAAAGGGMAASDRSNRTRAGGDGARSGRPVAVGPDGETSSCDARRDGRAGGTESVKGGEKAEEGAGARTGTAGGKSDTGTGTSARDGGNRGRLGDSERASNKGGADEAERNAERPPSPASPRRSSLPRRLSATFPGPIRRDFSDDDGTAGTGGGGGASGESPRSEELLAARVTQAFSRSSSPTSRVVSTTLRRRLSSVRATSTLKAAGASTTTYSPTQAVLNITWALRRLRPLGTPRERRLAFKGLRESSPVDIPQMFLLAFVDLAALGEIPRRTGDQFLGKADKRPVTVCELMARAGESGEDPVVVYVSHRWLEPDFKNPDDHSKARFYQARDRRRWFWSGLSLACYAPYSVFVSFLHGWMRVCRSMHVVVVSIY